VGKFASVIVPLKVDYKSAPNLPTSRHNEKISNAVKTAGVFSHSGLKRLIFPITARSYDKTLV
jgi:hypothetical protein